MNIPHLMANHSNPYHILIVDDENQHRFLEREILAAPKYAITEATNGREALDLVQATKFDVILLDVRMPGLNGTEVCRRIRGELQEPMLPIIMVTGFGGHDDLSECFKAGASDFIRKPYHPKELLARVNAAAAHKRLIDQLDNAESMLFALARMVEAKDAPTGDHCARLAHNAMVLGNALGLGEDELLALRRAGVLHDIGKLGIPDRILLKPAALDADEWAIMRRHTEIGARLCGGLKSMRLTVPIIRSHHERWDGSGYPDGLRGENIPLLARVFQMVDIYDSLIYARPYKLALPRAESIRIIEEEISHGWRDRDIAETFLNIVRKHPDDLDVLDPKSDLGADLFAQLITAGLPQEETA